MNNNTDKVPVETREISGCKIRLFFNEERNLEVKIYILNNLLDSFEKRNNISGNYAI